MTVGCLFLYCIYLLLSSVLSALNIIIIIIVIIECHIFVFVFDLALSLQCFIGKQL